MFPCFSSMAPLKPWFSFDLSKYILHMHSFDISVRLLLSVLTCLQLEGIFFKSLLTLSSLIGFPGRGQEQIESLLPPELNRFTDIQYPRLPYVSSEICFFSEYRKELACLNVGPRHLVFKSQRQGPFNFCCLPVA